MVDNDTYIVWLACLHIEITIWVFQFLFPRLRWLIICNMAEFLFQLRIRCRQAGAAKYPDIKLIVETYNVLAHT